MEVEARPSRRFLSGPPQIKVRGGDPHVAASRRRRAFRSSSREGGRRHPRARPIRPPAPTLLLSLSLLFVHPGLVGELPARKNDPGRRELRRGGSRAPSSCCWTPAAFSSAAPGFLIVCTPSGRRPRGVSNCHLHAGARRLRHQLRVCGGRLPLRAADHLGDRARVLLDGHAPDQLPAEAPRRRVFGRPRRLPLPPPPGPPSSQNPKTSTRGAVASLELRRGGSRTPSRC